MEGVSFGAGGGAPLSPCCKSVAHIYSGYSFKNGFLPTCFWKTMLTTVSGNRCGTICSSSALFN